MARMTVKEFVAKGFLREANRQFFHPLGLALEVTKEADGSQKFSDELQDYRDDPEGMIFQDLSGDEKVSQTQEIERLRLEKAIVRRQRFGFVIQPLGHKFEETPQDGK